MGGGRSGSRYSGGALSGSLVAVAGGAWAGYQVGRATSQFAHWNNGGSWQYKDWNSRREKEGQLCRTDEDCNWLFKDLKCKTYELSFTPDSAWFNGDYTSIVGQCECPADLDWDDWEMTCYEPVMSEWAIGLIVVICFLAIVLTGCVVKMLVCKYLTSSSK